MSLQRISIVLLLSVISAPACVNEAQLAELRDAAEPSEVAADCAAPFVTIVPPTSGSIVEIGLDETHVYFITHDALFSAPREGGDAQELFTRNLRSGSTLAALWVRADDLVVYQDAWNVFAVPKQGGRAREMRAIDRMRDGRFAARDGQLLTGWNSVANSQGSPEREWWLLDIENMQLSELGRVPAPAGDERGALGEGRLFWTDDPRQLVADTRVYAMPAAGGGVQEVAVSPRAERKLRLFGVDSGALYMLNESWVSRVPIAGGEIERLWEVERADDDSVLQFAASAAGLLLGVHDVQPASPVQRYWFERGTSEGGQLLPCIDAAELPAFALDGESVYVGLRDAGIALREVPQR